MTDSLANTVAALGCSFTALLLTIHVAVWPGNVTDYGTYTVFAVLMAFWGGVFTVQELQKRSIKSGGGDSGQTTSTACTGGPGDD